MVNNRIDNSFKKHILKRANYLFFDAQKEWFDFKQLSSPTEEQKASVDEMFNTKYDYPRILMYQ